jgi:hypothetical protein
MVFLMPSVPGSVSLKVTQQFPVNDFATRIVLFGPFFPFWRSLIAQPRTRQVYQLDYVHPFLPSESRLRENVRGLLGRVAVVHLVNVLEQAVVEKT